MGALSTTRGKSLTIGVIPRQRTVDHALPEARVGSLAVPMADHNITKRTLDLWQPRTSRMLSAEDAREMTVNVSGFFRLLAEWAQDAHRQQESPTNEHQTDT